MVIGAVVAALKWGGFARVVGGGHGAKHAPALCAWALFLWLLSSGPIL